MDGSKQIGEVDLLVAQIYEAAAGIADWRSVLAAVAETLGSERAFIGRYHLEDRAGAIEKAHNLEARDRHNYNTKYARENPWLSRNEFFQLPGLVWAGNHIVPHDDMARTGFYKEFLQPQDIFHTLHAVIDVSGSTVWHLVLTRPATAEQYGERDFEVCRRIMTHAGRAFELSRAMVRRRLIGQGFSTLLDHLPFGVALADSAGQVLTMNDLARQIIRSAERDADDPVETNSERPCANVTLPGPIRAAVASNDFDKETILAMERRDGRRPVCVVICPFILRAEFPAPAQKAAAVLLCDPERMGEIDIDGIRNLYQLTHSEARLSALLAGGDRIDEAAERLGISRNTARTHLKRIFGKTSTTRQAELVRLMLSTARNTGQARPEASAERSVKGPTNGAPRRGN